MNTLTSKDLELVAAVKAYARKFKPKRWRGEHISSVYAGVLAGGKTYIAPNIYHPYSGPTSICAEYSAAALAYADGNKDFDAIVAFHYRGPKHQKFYSPCGQCREFLRLFGDPWVIVPNGKKLGKERLSELLENSTE
jgi:cytidine deaminase